MKRIFAVVVAILFFVGAFAELARAQEMVLASKRGSISGNESIVGLAYRLAREAMDDARTHPCLGTAFRYQKEANLIVRVGVNNYDIVAEVISYGGCD